MTTKIDARLIVKTLDAPLPDRLDFREAGSHLAWGEVPVGMVLRGTYELIEFGNPHHTLLSDLERKQILDSLAIEKEACEYLAAIRETIS